MNIERSLTWEEFLVHLRFMEQERNTVTAWMFYAHPSIAKHHPKVKYLKRYDRRGLRMQRKRMGKKK